MAKFYCCTVTLFASDVLPETFEVKAKVKKGKVFFLNKVADTIRLFTSEIGPNPDRAWVIEYEGDLKEDFMDGLCQQSKDNPAVPLGGCKLWL